MSSQQTSSLAEVGMHPSIDQILHSHIDEMSLCPDGWIDPNEEFDEEVHSVVYPLLKRLAEGKAVETRTVKEDGKGDHTRYTEYRLTKTAREKIQHTLDNRDAMMPCGHSGMQNRGDVYYCTFELCDEEYGREDIEP